MFGLITEQMMIQGGVGETHARSLARSRPLYRFIDSSDGYYVNNTP